MCICSCAFSEKTSQTGSLLYIQGDSLGNLTSNEVTILDSLLNNTKEIFDFGDKKVAFISGSSGSRVLSKKDFFETCINPWIEEGKEPQIFLVKLDENEKAISGGYDALLLSWVKVFSDRQKRKTIKELGRSND